MPKKLCCQFDRRVSEGSTSATPCSTSSSPLDDPEPPATCSSSSSSPSSWYGSYLGLVHELRPIERTTSPLQMGHVRRRVVNHGVLFMPVSLEFCRKRREENSHAVGVEFMAARKPHYPTHAIDIFLQADDTLYLSSHVLPPFPRDGSSFVARTAGTGVRL